MSCKVEKIKRCDVVIVKKCTKTPEVLPSETTAVKCNFPLQQRDFPLDFENEDGVLVMDQYLEIKTKKIDVLEPEIKQEQIEENTCVDNPFDVDLTYLKNRITLPIADIKPLLFQETLLMCQGTGNSTNLIETFPSVDEIQEIGSTCILCETLDESDNILIFYTSQFTSNDEVKNVEILSVVDQKFKLIHEKRVEKTCCNSHYMEKSLHVVAEKGHYLGLKCKIENDVRENWKSEIHLNHTGNFLGYGACFLLMRYLITNKCSGLLHTWSFDMEGEMYLLEIDLIAPTCMQIHGKFAEIQRVNHNFYFKSGKIIQNQNYYHSKTGHLVKHSTSDSDCFMILNPFSDLPPNNYLLNLHENWEKDIQLMSMFLDYKTKRQEELKEQLEDSNFKFQTRDYMLCLARNKPTNIMEFTMSFIKKLEQKASGLQTHIKYGK
ncbi:unnamed protein product [Diamesa serratosioi]